MFEYSAEIIKVVDGDTVHANVDLGFNVHVEMTLRLMGINAPEKVTAEGKAAKKHLESLLPTTSVVIRTLRDKREKYGRYLAYVIRPDGVNVNDEMVVAGHAVLYDGGAR